MKTSLFDADNWREIGATLMRNKTRTFLTAFGIFWGTAMLVMLFGGSRGFEGILKRNFDGLSTNLGAFFSSRRSIPYKGFNKGTTYNITSEDITNIRKIAPAIEYSSEISQITASASWGTKSKSTQAMGVEADYYHIMTPVMYEGRFINQTDVAGMRKVMVIGKNLAADLFGAVDPVGKYVSVNGIYFQVVGVAGQLSDANVGGRVDDSIYLPSSTLRQAYNKGNNVDFFMYTAPRGKSPSDNEWAVRRVLSSAHSIHPDDENAVSFMDMSKMFEQVDTLFIGVKLLALLVGLGSLMAGVIGVGNIMLIVVKERTHEFGIRRAIGATPRDITVQVMSESIVLTLVAGLLGVCFGVGVLTMTDNMLADPLHGKAGFAVSFGFAIATVIAFFVFGTAAGTFPAIRAMKIKPIEAINDK